MTTTSNHGQGAVRNPAQDGRLKDAKSASPAKSSPVSATAHRSSGQGTVKNPATDGRLKDNR